MKPKYEIAKQFGEFGHGMVTDDQIFISSSVTLLVLQLTITNPGLKFRKINEGKYKIARPINR